jgi:hypothetical protein
VAENTKTWREVIGDNPFNHLSSPPHLATVRVPASMYVIYCHKLKNLLSAALTFAAVMLNNNFSTLPVPFTLVTIPAVADIPSPLKLPGSVRLPAMGTP